MSKKVLYLDTETTGTNPRRHGIIQFAGIIEIDGEVKETLNLKFRPFETDEIDDEALRITGTERSELESRMTSREAYQQICSFFSRHCNKFDRDDKFYPAGYNVRFDLDMLSEFFKKNGDSFLGSWINWRSIDGLALANCLDLTGRINLPNHKLSTLCEEFGIPIDAHDALSDITATRSLIKNIIDKHF